MAPDPRLAIDGNSLQRTCAVCDSEFVVYARRRVHSELCPSCRLDRERQGFLAIHEARATALTAKQTCSVCGTAASQSELDFVHLIPPGRGGSNGPENLVLICSECRSPAGRGTGAAMRPVCFRLPIALVSRLNRMADQRGRTASSLVREAVAQYIVRLQHERD
ncbi:MAG: ribbon-helix-helix protein, CopG family [Chloroflexi bacterium]|nr:ribbon-helix-helix protein, CopG family [Chloroflexota bacterium]